MADSRNGKYIKKLKSNFLRELDISEKNSRSDVEGMLPKNYVPTHEEMETALISYKNKLLQKRKQVKKIPTSFFQSRIKILVIVYAVPGTFLLALFSVMRYL